MQSFDRKALIVLNPKAGLKKANRFLTDIVTELQKGGYFCTSFVTSSAGEGKEISCRYAKDYDLIVAIGGDGTFNEVVSGIIAAGADTPIGYIPSGSTNDFASSLKLSQTPIKAARDIIEGNPIKIDVGSFGGRTFTYVASFGAFTESSYSTPQELKNVLGHLAYIIEGSKDIFSIKSYKMNIETEEKTFFGNYIFGAVSNSTSLGGILKINPSVVDMNDGLLELMFIKKPENIADLGGLISALNTKNYNNRMIDFCSAKGAVITAENDITWTVDGEKAESKKVVEIKNIFDRITLFAPKNNNKK